MKPPLTRPKMTPWTRSLALNCFSSSFQDSSRLAFSRDRDDDAVAVLVAVDVDVDHVADLHFGRFAGAAEFAHRNAAFGLQADVDGGEIAVGGDDGAFEHGALEAGVFAAEGFVQQVFEAFLREIGAFQWLEKPWGSILSLQRAIRASRLGPAVLSDAPNFGYAQSGARLFASGPGVDIRNGGLEHLFGVQARRIQNQGVLGGLQGGSRASAVLLVPFRHVRENGLFYNVQTFFAATPNSDVWRGFPPMRLRTAWLCALGQTMVPISRPSSTAPFLPSGGSAAKVRW